jgi:cyclomaltodextrinase / maltogenic alpha-amylase / neopullulanase
VRVSREHLAPTCESPVSSTDRLLADVDAAFRRGDRTLAVPPTRFYVNLTERCSLECVHCLNRSPEKTRSGVARDMPAGVIEALTPHLASALYVGLTHAGEPLMGPMLEPLLTALKRARAGEPSVVHLLTNGSLLDEERFVHLTELGVSSWAFSVDGMSSATHDRLRPGSQISELLAQIGAYSALRASRFPKVRLGIAWVVTSTTLHEISGLLEFARQCRLDWVKLEELFVVNAASARYGELEPDALQSVAAHAEGLAARLGVRLLNHLTPMRSFKCQLDQDDAMARFSRGDDFVNRMEINSCRLPYEAVALEPDGDVKPWWFSEPVAGNIRRNDLSEIWNRTPFVAARERSVAERRCAGVSTCARDCGPAVW